MSCLYQKTNGYWYISYFDINGERRNKATKTKLKREARLIQRQLDNELLDGNLQGFRKVKTKDWFKKIEDELHADPSLSDNWIRRKQFILNHLYRYFSSRAKYFHHIDLSMIESYRLDRLKSISVKTVNQEISVLKQIIKKAIAQEKYPNKPILLQIEMKNYKSPEVTPLELNEIIRIIEYMKTRFHPVQWWRTQFLAFSGCRLSELNLLRWIDVEEKQKIIWLRNHGKYRTKNAEDGVILMIEPIAEVLKAIKKNTFDKGKFRWRKGYIFPEVTKNSGTNLLKAFKKSQEALKISPIRVIHHLRHSFSTIIQEVAGLDISEAQLLLRHKTLTMTRHYTHRQAIKLWPKIEEFDLHLRDLRKQ